MVMSVIFPCLPTKHAEKHNRGLVSVNEVMTVTNIRTFLLLFTEICKKIVYWYRGRKRAGGHGCVGSSTKIHDRGFPLSKINT